MLRKRDVLVDTGPLVAILDSRDQWHAGCAATWPDVIERCVTTEAVLTEASHLVLRGGGAAEVPLDFLLAAGIPILGLETAGQRRAAALMRRYADIPMDYADATLVALAEALRITQVFTLDRRGFAAYRRHDAGAFALLP